MPEAKKVDVEYQDYDDYEVVIIDAQDPDIVDNIVVEDSDKDKSETPGVTVSEWMSVKKIPLI